MADSRAPGLLRTWFTVHFVVDVAFALPLFIAPRTFLGLLGWHTVDPFATRLVAAALFGIGIESLLGRNAGLESLRNMLNLKIIWSASATIGILATLVQAPQDALPVQWAILATFLAFHTLWVYYRISIGRMMSNG